MVKASQRTLRSTLQVLADLEERLESAQPPKEAQRSNGKHTGTVTVNR